MADFQQHYGELEARDAEVVALSADAEDDARRTVEKLGLRFPVVFGIDPNATSEAIGCYTGTHDGRPHVQPAGFVLTGDGVVALAVYSSGKVGRLTAKDALTMVDDLRRRASRNRAADS